MCTAWKAPMGTTWESKGIPLGTPWESYGHTMGPLYGKTMGSQSKTNGNPYGSDMGAPWA